MRVQMNYEELKAQFQAGEDGAVTGKRSQNRNSPSQKNKGGRARTPLDSLISMIPYALVFGAAMAIGTWYLQDTEAANSQFKQWIGMTVVNTEIDDEETEDEATADGPDKDKAPSNSL